MREDFSINEARNAAVEAAQKVGELMRRNLRLSKRVNEVTQHDIKLELDVRSQKLIEKRLRSAFPTIALLGEEGIVGDPESEWRWVVDPIDGSVNYAYEIPHASVSIALQRRPAGSDDALSIPKTRARGPRPYPAGADYEDGYRTLLGVVYDPFCDELWTGIRGKPALLNGKATHASKRRKLKEGIVSIGFAKTRESLESTLPYFNALVHRVRKIRIMGSAALALTYVASGRFDAYIEGGIRLWDIAAGGLIIECAGGEFWHEALPGQYSYRMIASNGLLRRQLKVPVSRCQD